MPELPEVETVCRGLAPVLEGQRLQRVIARRPDLRFPLPDGFGQRLTGHRVIKVVRRAKYILIHMDDGTVLIWHLGMSGRVLIYKDTHLDGVPPEQPHDHIIFETDANAVVRFNDTRRFGFMDLTDAAGLSVHPMIARLGPEPLEATFDAKELADRLKGKRTPVKSALLDQDVVAGLGNIYVSESLFRAGISPRRLAHTVQGQRAGRLVPAIKDVLRDAIQAGGSSLRDHRQTNGELGYFQHQFAVYGKAGEPCPNQGCDATIRQIVQSGRSTFFCPRCQR